MKCISPIYVRKVMQHVPCGKCAFCIKKAINGWCLRLGHEMEISSSAYFFTLTYAEDPEELQKLDVQKFMRALRKQNPGIRYFLIGEYGTQKGRPHYHAVIFNLENPELVTQLWTHGFVKGDKATMGRINYMVSYMALPQDVTHKQPPFRLMSRRPGIGSNYVEKFKHFHRARSDSVVYVFDQANAMPRYYKDKIYSNPHQKELVRFKAMQWSAQNPIASQVDGEQHERLQRKLQKKFR